MLVPKAKNANIAFYENHIGPWSTNAVAIGTTAATVTDLQTKTDAARAALTAQQQAYQTAKTATEALKNAINAMNDAGAGIIDQIRGMAKNSGNPNVYTLAEIPGPAIPAPVAPPAQPRDFKVSLDNGSLIITWKASNPAGAQGTIYRIFRSANGGPTTYLGDVGSKKFIDTDIPAGTTQVTYEIQGVRSTAAGMWGTFIVKFGTNAVGEATATIASTPKIAA